MSTPFAAMAGPSREWLAGAWLLRASIVSALLSVACNINNPGVNPPDRELNFPLVMAVSEPAPDGGGPDWLYVANTNYNLRYNAGSLQSFDLREVDKALERSCVDDVSPAACRSVGGSVEDEATGRCCLVCRDVADDILCDGRDRPAYNACCYDSLQERGRTLVPDDGEVLVESFISGLALASSGDRLYASVRGNDTLLTVDVKDGALDCKQGKGRRCADSAYVGVKARSKGTEARFARLPLDLVVGSPADFGAKGNGEFIFTGHDDGSFSFLVDAGDGPKLKASLPAAAGRVNSMQLERESGLVYVAQESGQQILRLGVEDVLDADGKNTRVPYYSSPLTLRGLLDNSFSRDLAFSYDEDMHLTQIQALVRGGSVDVRSLYFLEPDPLDADEAHTIDAKRVGLGPARVVQATLAGSPYLFVSCYDDRSLFIFAADTRQLVAFVRGLLGPFEFAIDEERQLAYVVDFASSTIRVVDLRGLSDASLPKPRIVLTLGKPDLESGAL